MSDGSRWREGDKVNFSQHMASGDVKQYYGTVHKQLKPNLFEIVGFGFTANVCGDLLKPTVPPTRDGAGEVKGNL